MVSGKADWWMTLRLRLAHRRGFNRMWLLVELVNLLLVFCFNHAALELERGRDFTCGNGKLVWHHHDFLDGLKLRQPLVQVFHNPAIKVAHLVCRNQFLP